MKIRNLVVSLALLTYSIVTLGSTTYYDLDVYRSFHKKDENSIQEIPLTEIDTYLNDDLVSVRDKTIDLKDINPHDYVSFDPYYWPNKNNPDAPYIRKDGVRNKKLVEQGDATRFQHMAKKVILLTRAYEMTDNEAYAQKAADFIRTWFLDAKTMMNPNMDHGHLIMGTPDGRASSITEARYHISLIEIYPILLSSRAWTRSDHEHLKDWYRKYYIWLISSKKGQEAFKTLDNNHGTWYDAQLMSIAIFLDRKAFAQEIAKLVKTRRIAKQIEPDGKQPLELKRTRSMFYSLFNLEALFACAELADKVNVDLWGYETKDGRSIQRAYDFVRSHQSDTKTWPYKQINKVEPWVWDKLEDRHHILLNIFR